MLFERKFDEILAETLKELTQDTRVNRISPGAKARALLEVLSRKLNESYKTFDLNLARAFVSGASGQYLDFIGDIFGLSRFGAEPAEASADVKAVRFFVEDGDFGDINNNLNILIPAGTVISTEPDGAGTRYRVTVATVLLATADSTYVSVTSTLTGDSQNVSAGSLNFHDFLTYTDAGSDSLKVTNDQGIFSGKNFENDTNFRFRITKTVLSAEAANKTAVQLAALSVAGVSEVTLFEYARGIGTFDVIIKAITPTVSTTLINAVQASLEAVKGFSLSAKARKPSETGITFKITVVYTSALPASERASIEQKIRNSLTLYVNNLDIGEDFIINEAVQRVLEVDERIKDIGEPGKPFDEISIYKESRLEDNRVRSTLLKNYTPAIDERVIIEQTVAVPIELGVAS